MSAMNRKTAPRVKGGAVQKKNNWAPTPDPDRVRGIPSVVRLRPGPGYRHVLKRRDVVDFVALLPDWDQLAVGLESIVLAPGEADAMGYHVAGAVHVCAWEEELWWHDTDPTFYDAHKDVLARLGVASEKRGGRIMCRWTESQARAFQLLDVLLHELGHHHDRITTASRLDAARGESYAEAYARRYADLIWDRYCETFGLP
jgi:hypothetical protein